MSSVKYTVAMNAGFDASTHPACSEFHNQHDGDGIQSGGWWRYTTVRPPPDRSYAQICQIEVKLVHPVNVYRDVHGISALPSCVSFGSDDL